MKDAAPSPGTVTGRRRTRRRRRRPGQFCYKPLHQAIQEVLNAHNDRHAWRNKAVSYQTREDRAKRIHRFYARAVALGFPIERPDQIDGKHVEAVIRAMAEEGLSVAYIDSTLSDIRTFCRWIGRDGVVRTNWRYHQIFDLPKRSIVAKSDRTWSGNGVDIEAVIARVTAYDPWCGLALELQFAFALRVKESLMFHPDDPHNSLGLLIERGTKGGRPRDFPFTVERQREILEKAKRMVAEKRKTHPDSHHAGPPGRTLKQAYSHFYYVLGRCGITKKMLNVSAHGLRHEYANQAYQRQTGIPSPIRGGPAIDREIDRRARLGVATHLGHGRRQISGAYLGGVLRSPRVLDGAPDPVPDEPDDTLPGE
ncbi:MAG TPA: phage integrase N-terminal domain-containing protein [Burkholderiales bacterium]|nr:phage integrase N-terminal domain-containing protein [Burkholderiales bacterium]